jgi:hypothetical protein
MRITLSDQSVNPVRGTVPIEIGGVTYIMRLNWHGIAQIRQLYPDGYDLMDMPTLAKLICVALPDHPDVTPEWIMDQGPPIEPTIELVSDMISYAWFGSKNPQEVKEPEAEENPPKKAAKKG